MSRTRETITAPPVVEVPRTVELSRPGFEGDVLVDDVAVVRRSGAELHRWTASDERWRKLRDPGRQVHTGAESFLAGTASCRVGVNGVDALLAEYREKDVLHEVSTAPSDKPWGTREFSALDPRGNLPTFFEPAAP